MTIDMRELAWAAGLFEGEGCFTLSTKPGHLLPSAQMTTTDEDTVRRFHAAVGIGAVHTRHREKEGYKRYWRWGTSGFPRVQAVAAMLWFGLGERRKARAKEILAGHKDAVGSGGRNKAKTHCPYGHPYNEANTYYTRVGRACRTCTREGNRRRYYVYKNRGQDA